jgi:SAM-dependent methyltransferase
VLDLAAPARSDIIVDVGCGNGMYLAELARRGCAGRVLGVDLSFGMLAAARDRLSGLGAAAGAVAASPDDSSASPDDSSASPGDTAGARPAAVALAGADATALPLRDGVADLALAMHMLYHVPDPADALRELRRVTRPGGRVVIVLNGSGHLRELRAAVARARGADPTAMRERVRLEDGESMARSFFAQVTRHDFVAELRVPSREPITDYVRSLSGTSRGVDSERVAEAVAADFPRTADGHYVITSHSGCLVCEAG